MENPLYVKHERMHLISIELEESPWLSPAYYDTKESEHDTLIILWKESYVSELSTFATKRTTKNTTRQEASFFKHAIRHKPEKRRPKNVSATSSSCRRTEFKRKTENSMWPWQWSKIKESRWDAISKWIDDDATYWQPDDDFVLIDRLMRQRDQNNEGS